MMQIALFILFIPLGFLAFCRPWIGVISLFFLQVFLASGSKGVTAIEFIYLILFIVTLSAWFFKYSILKRFRLPKTPLIPAIVLFIIYCSVSVVFAISKNIPLLHWLRQWYTFASLLLILPIVTEFKNKKRLKILIGVFLLTATIVSLSGIYSNLSKDKVIAYASAGIPSTIYIWGTILIIGLIGHVKHRIGVWVLLGLLSIGLFRSVIEVSRSTMASIVIGAFVILWITFIAQKTPNKIKLRYIKIAILGIMGISLIGSLIFPNLISNVVNACSGRLSHKSLQRGLLTRYLLIKAALGDWRESPLIGQGFGYNFKEVFLVSRTPAHVSEIAEVHNLYVYLLSHSGVMGLGFYLFILGMLLKEGIYSVRRTSNNFDKGTVLGLFGAYMALIAFAFFSVRANRIEVQSFLALAGGIFILINNRHKNTKHSLFLTRKNNLYEKENYRTINVKNCSFKG
jgi:O-antigen ligase